MQALAKNELDELLALQPGYDHLGRRPRRGRRRQLLRATAVGLSLAQALVVLVLAQRRVDDLLDFAEPVQALLEVLRAHALDRERERPFVDKPVCVGQLGRMQQNLDRVLQVLNRFAVLLLELLVGERPQVAHQRAERGARKALQRVPAEQLLDLDERAQEQLDALQADVRFTADARDARVEAAELVELLHVLHVVR